MITRVQNMNSLRPRLMPTVPDELYGVFHDPFGKIYCYKMLGLPRWSLSVFHDCDFGHYNKTDLVTTDTFFLRTGYRCINTLRPIQNVHHFLDSIFRCIFLNENVWIFIKISVKFVSKGPNNHITALVQIMAWRRPGDKPLFEPMLVDLKISVKYVTKGPNYKISVLVQVMAWCRPGDKPLSEPKFVSLQVHIYIYMYIYIYIYICVTWPERVDYLRCISHSIRVHKI